MAERLPLSQVVEFYVGGCQQLGSPFYSSLLDRMRRDVERGGPISVLLAEHEQSTIEAAVPLRFLGGVHRLVLEGRAPALARHYPSVGGDGDAAAAWPALLDAVASHEHLVRRVLTRPPQTNEVGRSIALVGGFLVVSQETRLPQRLLELGASAALNLRVDRYWFESDGRGAGDPDSPVRFVDRWSRPPPFGAELRIVERRGCDRDPVDATTADGRLTLLSYVWPDQTERIELLRAALDIAREFPVAVDRADIASWLDAQLERRADGVATVVFHSIVWQYLTDEQREAADSTLAAAGSRATPDAPLAWLRLEPGPGGMHTELRLTTWPGGNEQLLASTQFHVGHVDWLA